MKSAKERASEAFDVSQVNRSDFVLIVAEMFEEHAGDQRRICAAKVNALGTRVTGAAMRTAAFDAVLTAPAPGEDR